MALGYLEYRVEVCRLAVEVYGQNSARARRYRGLYRGRIYVAGVCFAVHEDGRSIRGRDGLGRGEEGVGRDDDFVARTDSARGERELYRGRAVRDADAELRADVLCERALERLDLWAEDEGGRVQNALDGRVHLRLYRAILRL